MTPEESAYYYIMGWIEQDLKVGKRTNVKTMIGYAHLATGCKVDKPELFGLDKLEGGENEK